MVPGNLVKIHSPPFDADDYGLVVQVKNTSYGYSTLVLLTNGEYYSTNTLHCELIGGPRDEEPRRAADDRAHQKRV